MEKINFHSTKTLVVPGHACLHHTGVIYQLASRAGQDGFSYGRIDYIYVLVKGSELHNDHLWIDSHVWFETAGTALGNLTGRGSRCITRPGVDGLDLDPCQVPDRAQA
ncbi:hypothetical protein RRG08_060985 [Elysia crispata]|uniref:Uncharacterized protein n=1 Tax=Elysia crispata TaxID=231223 RepID=A0AAE1AUL2_9GAST|nr:hypothetical protein RRG08_060985 [Elysia crispata]